MTFTPAEPASLTAFVAVVAAVSAAVPAGAYAASRRLGQPAAGPTARVGVGLLLWILAWAAVVASGLPAARPMPGVPLLLAAAVLAAVAFGLSPVGGRLARGLPLAALVGFQAFRLPLELVLHAWARHGTIPVTMTWDGQNFDVVSGVVAAAAAPWAGRSRAVAWAANLVGAVLLVNVFRVAAMSSPLPFAWPVEPPLQLVFHLPYALIVPVCVAGAAAGHVVLTRALMAAHRPPMSSGRDDGETVGVP